MTQVPATRPWSGILTDIRLAARTLRRQKRFCALVAATLSLGIGSATAVFGMADRLLLRALPGVHDDGRTDYLRFTTPTGDAVGITTPEFDAIRRDANLLHGISSYSAETFGASYAQVRGVHAQTAFIYGDYMDVLGVRAEAGRLLHAADTRFDADPMRAVLSERMAIQLFGTASAAVGQTFYLSDQPVTVLGVAADGFAGAERDAGVDVWLPLAADAPLVGDPIDRLRGRTGAPHYLLLVRAKPGAGRAAVAAQLRQLVSRLAVEEPQYDRDNRLGRATPALSDGIALPLDARPRIESVLRLLAGMAGLVLVIACANAANLLLVRNVTRRGTVAMQRALGASPGRIGREHFIQSILLGTLGAFGGIAVGWTISAIFRGQHVGDVSAFAGFPLDGAIVVFAALSAIVTAALAGTVPGVLAGRFDLDAALRAVDTRHSSGLTVVRRVLTSAQLALTLTLGVGTLLLVRTLHNLTAADTGLDFRGVASFWQSHRVHRSRVDDDVLARRMLAALDALPGVRAAVGPPDLDQAGAKARVGPRGAPPDQRVEARVVPVTADWFDIFRVAAAHGRLLTDRDWKDGPPYDVVLTASLARKLFGTDDAVDRTLDGVFGRPALRVVGILRNLAGNQSPDTPKDIAFVTYDYPPAGSDGFSVVLRASHPDAALRAQVRNALAQIFPDQTIEQPMLLSAAGAHRDQRTLSGLIGLLSALAAWLGAVGLYGFVAFLVSARRREFAVRIALGAAPARIGRLVLGDAAIVVGSGAALGLGGGYAIARALEHRLFGVGPFDLAAYAGAALLLSAIAAVACAIPVWRAVQVDPVDALRAE